MTMFACWMAAVVQTRPMKWLQITLRVLRLLALK